MSEMNDKNAILEAVSDNTQYVRDTEEMVNEIDKVAKSIKAQGVMRMIGKVDAKCVFDKITTVLDKETPFQFASEELRGDREFVEEVISINGMSLRYASEELRNDRDLIKIAMRTNPCVLKYIERVDEELRGLGAARMLSLFNETFNLLYK